MVCRHRVNDRRGIGPRTPLLLAHLAKRNSRSTIIVRLVHVRFFGLATRGLPVLLRGSSRTYLFPTSSLLCYSPLPYEADRSRQEWSVHVWIMVKGRQTHQTPDPHRQRSIEAPPPTDTPKTPPWHGSPVHRYLSSPHPLRPSPLRRALQLQHISTPSPRLTPRSRPPVHHHQPHPDLSYQHLLCHPTRGLVLYHNLNLLFHLYELLPSRTILIIPRHRPTPSRQHLYQQL